VHPETAFRRNRVLPFLKKLPNTVIFPIQQLAIIGDPDYILCINGYFVALELKTDTGTVAALQQAKLDAVETTGGFSMVARPKTWAMVKKRLELLAKQKKVDLALGPNIWD
jgi:hypothetical protein